MIYITPYMFVYKLYINVYVLPCKIISHYQLVLTKGHNYDSSHLLQRDTFHAQISPTLRPLAKVLR